MKFDFLQKRSAERFAELLDAATESWSSGRHGDPRPRRGHGGTTGAGAADDDFAELVAIGHRLSTAGPEVRVDSEFRTGLRAMLLATAERDGIGVTAAGTEPEIGAHAGVREPGRGLFRAGSARRVRVRATVVVSVAAGAMAVSGISAASENASPGDALYGVKRSTEKAQLAMAGSDVTRGQLSLDFARTRLTEAGALPGDTDAFPAVLSDMDADTRQGVKLLTGSAVARKDAAPLGAVESFVSAQRGTFKPLLAKLSPGNAERAQQSLDLLDAASTRVANLRAGLACANPAVTGTDSLGPSLASCTTASDLPASPEPSHGPGQRQSSRPGPSSTDPVRPERTKPATGADATGNPSGPGANPAGPGTNPADGVSPSPSTSPSPEDGLLGGLLGGILGGK